jgi:uncharacterized membrane protein
VLEFTQYLLESKSMKKFDNFPKYIVGLLLVLLFRLVPRPPNVEPITATMMPYSKKWGSMAGIVFCLISVLGYDLISGSFGVWSFITAGTFCLLGLLSGFYFKNRESNIKNYLIFAIFATLLYDAITGLGIGTVFFGQNFVQALVGQVPFTLYHLAGNIVFATVLSPALFRWVVENEKFDVTNIFGRFKVK